jgi:hypothetical protein
MKKSNINSVPSHDEAKAKPKIACRLYNSFPKIAPLAVITGIFLMPAVVHAAIPGTLGGTAYMSYNQAVWATMVESYIPLDISGNPVGDTPVATEDTFGKRFYYPQKFMGPEFSPASIKGSGLASEALIANGTADPIAVEQWRIYDPAQRVPLPQPVGGFAMPVDPIGSGIDPSWGVGHKDSYSYNPDDESTFPAEGLATGYSARGAIYDLISLGGTFRLASDLVSPGGSLWWSNMTIEGVDDESTEFSGAEKWYIGSRGTREASHTTFELVNPVFGVDPTTGLTTLEADYKWGDSVLSQFFGLYIQDKLDENGNYVFDENGGVIQELNPTGQKILGHISLNPSAVPVPGSVWLFGSALFGFLGTRFRKFTHRIRA